jgi:hypothetical protein
MLVTLDNSDNWTKSRHAAGSSGLSGLNTHPGNAIENRSKAGMPPCRAVFDGEGYFVWTTVRLRGR